MSVLRVFCFCGKAATVFLFIVLIVCLVSWLRRRRKIESLIGKHVIVTGGSSGIGKEVAANLLKRGATVTLIARNLARLEETANKLKGLIKDDHNQDLKYFPLDVGGDYEEVKSVVEKATVGMPVYMLINCAGTSIPGRLEDLSIEALKTMLNVNLLGTLQMTKAVLPQMKSSEAEGHIVLVGSQASLLGLYGFTAYSSTKFAIRGLAEALHMECEPHKVSVTLALPPDTDTPGFAEEERSKPIETKLISQTAGLYSPREVADKLVQDALDGQFFSTIGFESWLLKTLCTGMAPVSSLFELLTQVTFMGLMRMIGAGYLFSFQRIVHKCMKNRDQSKKSE